MEQRLINANALFSAIEEMEIIGTMDNENDAAVSQSTVLDIVFAAKTIDAVQVVRCRECKRWGTPIPIEMKEDGYGYCGGLWTNTHKDDYCAWGERRNDEHL